MKRRLPVRPAAPFRIRKTRPERFTGMDDKDISQSPTSGENRYDDSAEAKPDLASYYAAAATAAASGHAFSADEVPDAADTAAVENNDAAPADDTADQNSSAEESDASKGSESPRESEDISEDGSPHGPLNLFSDSSKEQPEEKNAEDGKNESNEESHEQEISRTDAGEPVPPYENVPAFASFQAPEKTNDREEDDEEPEGAEDDVPMSIIGHLNELRRRLFRIVIIVVLGFVAFYGVSEPLYAFLSAPLQACMPEGSKLIYTSPQGAFFTYMKVALVASLFGTSPFTFYQLWAFIAPGLYREEKRAVLPLAFFSSVFFLAGASFCFILVFPIAFQFFMGFASETIVPMISVEEYLSFALKLLIAFGVVFEMPLFAYFLSRFGLLTPAFMRRSRRYAVLVIFIVAAILTPPDVFSQCLMAIPMLLLYEVSIYVSAMAYKKKEDKSENKDEKEEA